MKDLWPIHPVYLWEITIGAAAWLGVAGWRAAETGDCRVVTPALLLLVTLSHLALSRKHEPEER